MHVSICLVGRRVVEGKEVNMKSVCVCGGDVCMSTAQLRGQTFPHELFQYAMHKLCVQYELYICNHLISLYVDLYAAAVFMWCVCVCLYYWFDWEHY